MPEIDYNNILNSLKESLSSHSNIPSSSPKTSSIVSLPEIEIMEKIFAEIEKSTADIAESLFDYLFDIDDFAVASGEIPEPKDGKIKGYIKALNKLFRISRNKSKFGSFRLINRKIVKDLDKKTYLFCMCIDGGVSLDILCEIVNQENNFRTPKSSPIKITVMQFAPGDHTKTL